MHETEQPGQPSNFTLESNGKQTVPANINKYTAISSMLFIFIASLATYLHYSRRDQPFKPYIDTSSYYPEQSPKIYAGQVHYSRIPVEYWEHRIMMIKSMGLNALSVYIMWNYHQIEKGRFDFETQNKNLSYFLELAEKHEMKVLIRPGPYVCAEWDFGGLPARLLSVEGLQIRSIEKKFMDQVEIYFTAVAPIIRKHLWTQQNPTRCIIMLQIENQYGFFGTDIDYILALRKLWRKLNVHTAEYYVDWFINVRKSHWKGANIGLNDAFTQVEIDYIKTTLQPKGYIFGGQIYSGWLTWWHSPNFELKDPQSKVKQFQFLMSHNLSYSMYMAHGGTSFGLTAGANARYSQQMGYAGQLTSYDYDAPINEQGSATKKYHIFRQAIKKYASWYVPDVPIPIPMIKITPFELKVAATILDNINWAQPSTDPSMSPYVFESSQLQMFNLGIVIYQIVLPANFKDSFTIVGHDLVFITIDGKFYQLLDRTLHEHSNVTLQCKLSSPCTVRFMVEAMGHVNYDLSMKEDKKGIISFKSNTNPSQQFEWKMYKIPLHDNKILEWTQAGNNLIDMPVLLSGNFTLEDTGDTYLNMKKYNKGYVWVNGRNLGRFWNVGPQYKLFCPGVWLKKGNNQVYVLDLKYSGQHKIQGELTLNEKQSDF